MYIHSYEHFWPKSGPILPPGINICTNLKIHFQSYKYQFFWPNCFFFIWKCLKIVLYLFQCKNFTLLRSSTGEFFYMNSSLEPPTRVSLKCIAIAHFVCKNPCPIYYNICLGLVLRNNTTTQVNFLF